VLHGAGQTNKFRLKEKIMFTYDTVIDTVQTGKKQFVKTFVQNETAANAMNEFIDAQAEYTKKATKVGVETFTTLTTEMVKAGQNAMKFDYNKFGEGIMKAYTSTAKK
jgi:hypothetical protein